MAVTLTELFAFFDDLGYESDSNNPEEIIAEILGLDSTENVEIAGEIKKKYSVAIGPNELNDLTMNNLVKKLVK